MKKIIIMTIAMVSIVVNLSFAGSYTYLDDFNDVTYGINWAPLPFGGTWSYPGNGTYTGTIGAQFPTVSSLEIPLWPDLTSTGLSISADFTILTPPAGGEYNAGLFFGGNNPPGNTNIENVSVYTTGITLGPNDEAYFFAKENTDQSFDILQPLGVGIGASFKLQIAIDQNNQLFWDVDQWAGLSWLDVDSGSSAGVLPVYNGTIGVYANGIAQFTEFSVSGDPVPISSAIFLFGLGFMGLVGLRRRQ